MRPFVVCVDFDGTIVEHKYPALGEEVPLALQTLIDLNRLGAKVVLFTMRSGKRLQQAVDFLEEAGVELYGVNRNPDQDSWTDSPKAYGHVYVDDAAFGCPLMLASTTQRPMVDWSKVRPELLARAGAYAEGLRDWPRKD